MISHQELLAQQVCSYLMGYGDHYTSHRYRNLYWTSFERYLENCGQEYGYHSPDHELNSNEESDYPEFLPDMIDLPEIESEKCIPAENFEEVTIAADRSGIVIPKANQVADYVFCSDDL
jgi:hypothetical protein